MTLKLQFYGYSKKLNQNISNYFCGLKSIANSLATINCSILEKDLDIQDLTVSHSNMMHSLSKLATSLKLSLFMGYEPNFSPKNNVLTIITPHLLKMIMLSTSHLPININLQNILSEVDVALQNVVVGATMDLLVVSKTVPRINTHFPHHHHQGQPPVPLGHPPLLFLTYNLLHKKVFLGPHRTSAANFAMELAILVTPVLIGMTITLLLRHTIFLIGLICW